MHSLSTFLWAVLVVYGIAMLAISPRALGFGDFFEARDKIGREVGLGLLVGSVVISWIFAKSITNAANLGASYGFVGSVAYAAWYLSIPVAGVVIYGIRKTTGARSVAHFLTSRYGRGATGVFMLVILMRLANEVWSNTAVVGAYFGPAGSPAYYGAALLFTAFTLAYSLRGGLRSSIITDAVQAGLAVVLLALVIGFVLPHSGAAALVGSGSWTMKGGVDLVLVGLVQSFSYPFHDPVLTDRAFITGAKKMLVGYLLSGVLAGAFIAIYGLVGVQARLAGIAVHQDAAIVVADALGTGALVTTTVLMMVSAGSTLDSTLASFSRAVAVDVAGREGNGEGIALLSSLARRLAGMDTLLLGRRAMVVVAIVGSLPLFTGAAILKATTVSGTMVLGLAPAFLLYALRRPGPAAFHLGFWPGVGCGLAYALGAWPASLSIGGGDNAALLGANVFGTALVFAGFAIGTIIDARRRPVPSPAARAAPTAPAA